MADIRTSNGLHFAGLPDRAARVVAARDAIARRECAARGWDVGALSFEQILVIRALPEWKEPLAAGES